MRVHITDSAYRDLEEINKYHEQEGIPHVAERLLAAILDRVETLVDHPDIGRIVPEFGQEKIRELIHSPFRIVYSREPESVHVLRVWRSERLLELPESGKP